MVHGASMVQDEDATMLRLKREDFCNVLGCFPLFLDVSWMVFGW